MRGGLVNRRCVRALAEDVIAGANLCDRTAAQCPLTQDTPHTHTLMTREPAAAFPKAESIIPEFDDAWTAWGTLELGRCGRDEAYEAVANNADTHSGKGINRTPNDRLSSP